MWHTSRVAKPSITVEATPIAVYKADYLGAAVVAVSSSAFSAIMNTDDGVWITTETGIPNLEVVEPACHLLRISDTTDFPIDLSEIVRILGENGVGIIPTCSYGGDYLLVKDEHLNTAITALTNHHYPVTDTSR